MNSRRGRLRPGVILAWVAAWLSGAAPAGAQVILDAIPGGVVEIPLGSAQQARPEAFFGQHRTLVTRFGERWASLVGLPLDLVPGIYVLQARVEGEPEMVPREFTVYPRRIRDHPVVDQPPLPLDNPPVSFTWRETLDAEFPLNAPVSSAAEPLFGRYRRISESESGYVDFVRFRIETDLSVLAPASGMVAAVETGRSGTYVWVDHGMALFTCVGPLTRTPLRLSDTVQAGEALGKVVLDSADEPAPLYWSVYLNGTAVNPFLVADIEPQPDAPRATRNDSR